MSGLIRALAIVLPLLVVAADCASAQYRGGCRGSGLSCAQLDYYCSQGNQTPISVRPYCGGGGAPYRRYDGPSYGGYGDYRGRRLSYEELRYYCSQGDQTPISVRGECIRSGLW